MGGLAPPGFGSLGSLGTGGQVFTHDGSGRAEFRSTEAVASIGEQAIANADRLRRQRKERVFQGAPKQWRVTNRAQLGHVKVWMGVFDGEVYPEGADRENRATWLQPGELMLIDMQAGLHFFGNVFDPRIPEALDVIERCGGLELETQKENPGRNPEVRVIGGPIGLPDVIIVPIDGRLRVVGEPYALYERYEKAWRKMVRTRKGTDPSVLAEEKALLESRIAEYLPDGIIYGADGRELSTPESRADVELGEAPSMDNAPEDDTPAIRKRR